VGIGLGQGSPGELPGRPADGAKQRLLGIGGDAGPVEIGLQVGHKIVVARKDRDALLRRHCPERVARPRLWECDILEAVESASSYKLFF